MVVVAVPAFADLASVVEVVVAAVTGTLEAPWTPAAWLAPAPV